MKRLFYLVCAISLQASVCHGMDAVQKQIAQWKEQGKREGWTFEIGDNPTLHMSPEERTCFHRERGWKGDASWTVLPPDSTLPQNWDWRDKHIVSDVKNQHSPHHCGSCWAFGTVAVFESLIKMASGRDVDISEQQLVSCEPSYGTCSGGYFAFGFYQQKGANYRTDFPYEAQDIDCHEQAARHEKITSWGYVGDQDRGATTEQIKRAIYKYGPIAATVSASGAWDAYKSGVYNACNSNQINHIVAIVGWNEDDKAWIVKNSHGKQWGDNGYIRIKYVGRQGQKCNGIAESVAYGVYKP